MDALLVGAGVLEAKKVLALPATRERRPEGRHQTSRKCGSGHSTRIECLALSEWEVAEGASA